MITLFRTRRSEGAAAVEETLDELCLAHATVVIESGDKPPPEMPLGRDLPVLVDEHNVFEGTPAILAHLQDLEAYRDLWYKFQSDVCYYDEEGE